MTRRLQQRIAIDAAAAPTSRVAERYGLSWGAVRRAEKAAIGRWEATRSPVPLVQVGVDEKWLGRRHRLDHKFVTIVSNLETGEPIWIGRGRNKAILAAWLAGLSDAEKQGIDVFALDMYGPFLAAIEEAKGLEHAAVVHDPFHILKRVGEAIDDARRDVFFRAGPDQRAVGRGARWLLLRAWERNSAHQRAELAALLACNAKLARAYQLKEQIRHLVVHAPDALAMHVGLKAVLRRTQRSSLPAIRKLGDALEARWPALLRLADHRPPTGRIEALNNNWEALVRRSRGCRDHDYLLRKLRFMIANPLRSLDGLRGFVALGQAA